MRSGGLESFFAPGRSITVADAGLRGYQYAADDDVPVYQANVRLFCRGGSAVGVSLPAVPASDRQLCHGIPV